MSRVPGSWMRAEMAEQPGVVAAQLGRRAELEGLLSDADVRPERGVIVVARGSSDHAAIYARYLWELVVGVPVTLAAPSLYTRYGAAPDLTGWVAVAFSQSGETPEIVETTAALRSRGARTVGVTNAAASLLATHSDVVVDLECGPERAVPATKTMTASLAAVVALGAAWGEVPWSVDDERSAVAAVASVLDDAVDDHAAELLGANVVTHLGRGYTFPVALEGALKFRESTGRAAEGLSAADYLHGPVAATHQGSCVVGYAAAGPVAGDVVRATAEASARGAGTLLVAPDDVRIVRVAGTATTGRLPVPAGLVEPLAVLPMTVRGQQLALAAALAAGGDPDNPFGLHKITLT